MSQALYGTYADISVLEPIDESADVEDEEESFVLSSLCTAASEGNVNGIEELLEKSDKVSIHSKNRHGETLLHVAASNGQLEVVKYLHDKGADLKVTDKKGDTVLHSAARHGHLEALKYFTVQGQTLSVQNTSQETPAHLAARYGHVGILDYLCSLEIDVNAQDKLGDTALHVCAWNSLHPAVIVQLCKAGAKPDLKNKEGETVLHVASSRGHIECVRILLQAGANIDEQDQRGNTALHLACKRGQTGIALVLLHAQCQLDIIDAGGETPLHAAARDGLLPIVQTMCAFGCKVDVVSNAGVTALHQSARSGHVEVVRCLLLSGADPNILNSEGVSPEILAISQGEIDTATLLNQSSTQRDQCVRQLMPGGQALSRVKVKVFGASGVGKSTVVDSLKCGYFGSFFRKSRLMANSAEKSAHRNSTESNGTGSVPSTPNTPKAPPLKERPDSLTTQVSFEGVHESYTKGISAEQLLATSIGDLSVWEFSGFEPYFLMYDLFIGDPNCIHIIVFNCEEPKDVQLIEVLFWLHFLKARMAPLLPVAMEGAQPWPAKVLLVATHADTANCPKNKHGEFHSENADIILGEARKQFEADFDIHERVFVMDAHLAMSAEFKAFRTHMSHVKEIITRSLPVPNGFLDAVVAALPAWRKMTSMLPVVTWPSFIMYVRSKVNMLASEDHLKELMCQLQLCGEVVYVESEREHDLVVLDPNWLGSRLLGQLLSHEKLTHTRPTGVFTREDLELNLLPEISGVDVLPTLEALELCTPCELDGDVEYEFPCFNFVETLEGLWEPESRYNVYGGVRLTGSPGSPSLLQHIFPRIQVSLRRDFLQNHNSADCDLYQWYRGAKYCSGALEAMITTERNHSVIEIKCRGTDDARTELFYFFEDVYHIVMDAISDMCPGLGIERHLMSPAQLKQHVPSLNLFAYAPFDVMTSQLNGSSIVHRDDDEEESLIDLICFGSKEVIESATLGGDLHVGHLNVHARRCLCAILDPADPIGRDWCLLAVSLGLTDALPHLDNEPPKHIRPRSKTDRALEVWSRDPTATISKLISKLKEMERSDAVKAVLTYAPLFHIFQDDNSNVEKPRQGEADETEPGAEQVSPSFDSDSTLASR